MEITVKTRSAGSEYLRIFINVHDGGKHPVERPSVKGVKIKKNYWNPNGNADKKNWVRTTHSHYPRLNQQIHDKLIEVEAKYSGQNTMKVIERRERAITGGRKIFLTYANQFILERRNASTRTNDKYGIKKLTEFLEGRDNVGLQFKEITKQLVKEYYAWLLENVSAGSANQYMNTFRTIFNAAGEDERVQIKVNQNPFEKLKKAKSQKRNKALTKQELTNFRNFEVPQAKPKWLEAKNMFLFQFSGAYRVKDILYLRWRDLRKTDAGLIWNNYTSKTYKQFTRTLPLEVQLLLVPSLKRYFPDIGEVILPLQNQILELKKKVGDGVTTPEPMSAVKMLNLLKSGSSLKDVEEQIQKESLDKQQVLKDLQNKQNDLMQCLTNRILDLSFDYADDYVWSYGNRKGFTRKISCEMEKAKVTQSISSYDRFLDVLRKDADIRTLISSHVARHTATVNLLVSGASPEEVSKFLTHTSLSTTETYRSSLGLNDSALVMTLGGML